MSLRLGSSGRAPAGLFTLMMRPSENSTWSKKHMYGLCRESEPVTWIFVPALSDAGVRPVRESCVTPCDSHTYSRVLPFSSTAEMCR